MQSLTIHVYMYSGSFFFLVTIPPLLLSFHLLSYFDFHTSFFLPTWVLFFLLLLFCGTSFPALLFS